MAVPARLDRGPGADADAEALVRMIASDLFDRRSNE
jgi:hypothetical protein